MRKNGRKRLLEKEIMGQEKSNRKENERAERMRREYNSSRFGSVFTETELIGFFIAETELVKCLNRTEI